MANICLLIGTSASLDNTLATLNSLEGLQTWWTETVSGSTAVGAVVTFHFNSQQLGMKVLDSTATSVVWECVDGPEEWLGTTIHFDLEGQDHQTLLMFKHAGWAAETPFFHHCSTKWATFLLSLRSYLQTGQGNPFPNDVHIELDR